MGSFLGTISQEMAPYRQEQILPIQTYVDGTAKKNSEFISFRECPNPADARRTWPFQRGYIELKFYPHAEHATENIIFVVT